MAARSNPSDRHRQLAIHHANLIHHQKDVSSAIFDSLEGLIDFPTSSQASPSQPSAADLDTFRQHVAPFQVSDYDALIAERNAARKCGYVFCPRPYKDSASEGKFRILWGGSRGHELKIVPRNEVQRWCSVECARRAMYVKVQLSEVPAWERASGLGNKIEVLQEADEETLAEKMKRMTLDKGEESGLKEAMAELALERGDSQKGPRSAAFSGIVVKENIAGFRRVEPPKPLGESEPNHLRVEGYTPRIRNGDQQKAMSEPDFDWDLS